MADRERKGLPRDFQIALWNAIDKWARGNIAQRMQAVVDVEGMIEDAIADTGRRRTTRRRPDPSLLKDVRAAFTALDSGECTCPDTCWPCFPETSAALWLAAHPTDETPNKGEGEADE